MGRKEKRRKIRELKFFGVSFTTGVKRAVVLLKQNPPGYIQFVIDDKKEYLQWLQSVMADCERLQSQAKKFKDHANLAKLTAGAAHVARAIRKYEEKIKRLTRLNEYALSGDSPY